MKYLMIFVILVSFTGCEGGTTSALEQAKTEENQQRLLAVQPPVQLEWSLERENINKRTNLWNDKNKVSYIYLVDFGKVMAFYTIKGKVSSVNSQITNPAQLRRYATGSQAVAIPSPAEDGSYGSNGDGIFFFCTDGTYVEWAGKYMLCDKPLKMSTPPAITRSIK